MKVKCKERECENGKGVVFVLCGQNHMDDFCITPQKKENKIFILIIIVLLLGWVR